MMKRCLDEALLQAYMDGELSRELTAEAAAHIAACVACASSLAEVENESAFFAAAFAPDEHVSAPTEALRSRINAAVAQLESVPEQKNGRGWRFGGFLASLSGLFTFTPQGAVAFASVLALVALASVFFVAKRSQQQPASRQIARSDVDKTNSTASSSDNSTGVDAPTPAPAGRDAISPKPVRYVPRSPGKNRGSNGTFTPQPEKELLPGEKQYQTAIASLEKTIKSGGDAVLKPSVRVDYERNLALLDSTIGETRRVAAANPKDKDAVGFLMATYQSKVELLSKVADQAQVAALGR